MIEWRIYYGDGSTFDNTQGSPEDAPGFDVQCVVQPDPKVNKTILHRHDFYFWNIQHDTWFGSSSDMLIMRLVQQRPCPVGTVLSAYTIYTADYDAIFRQATQDPDFLPKAGVERWERGDS